MTIDLNTLEIDNPKRTRSAQSGWEGFFPYYAGFPESFAERLIRSAKLSDTSIILDPWNGSGTTTYTASKLGIPSIGVDVNPVMAVVARARTLPPSERDSLVSLGRELVARALREQTAIRPDEPLAEWFGPKTSAFLRDLERSARVTLISDHTRSSDGTLDDISAMASTFYVAIFSVARSLAARYRTSNPTWIRRHRHGERRASGSADQIAFHFLSVLQDMADALAAPSDSVQPRGTTEIRVADTSSTMSLSGQADLVLTSPPYCTRLDYTAATRIQLAILSPVMAISRGDLSRKMTGSIRVPAEAPKVSEAWGSKCNEFLEAVKRHPSKASDGYYYKNHADYFDKMYRSLANLAANTTPGGAVIIVAQDSYYKDVHNDVPAILSEMAASHSLHLGREERFSLRHTMAGSHPHTKNYRNTASATESVLCFSRIG